MDAGQQQPEMECYSCISLVLYPIVFFSPFSEPIVVVFRRLISTKAKGEKGRNERGSSSRNEWPRQRRYISPLRLCLTVIFPSLLLLLLLDVGVGSIRGFRFLFLSPPSFHRFLFYFCSEHVHLSVVFPSGFFLSY